jgi:hypothetical protein
LRQTDRFGQVGWLVVTLDNACVFEALTECAHALRHPVRRSGVEEPDHRHRLLLRTRGKRPGRGRAAEQRDELAPLHSITSSARASSGGGTTSMRNRAD